MALADVTTLLQGIALDRGTKLQVLAILAANPDPKAVEDIETMLRSFREMDEQENAALSAKLGAIDAAYQEKVAGSDASLDREVAEMNDDIDRNDEIEKIRQTLS